MSFAFRLHDYRLFCTDCSSTCDVRAIDESDAEREALKLGWRKVEGKGLLDPLCVEFHKRNKSARKLPGTRQQESA